MFNIFYKQWEDHECEPDRPKFGVDWFKHSIIDRKYRAFAIVIDVFKKGHTFTFVLDPEEYMIDNYLDLDCLYDNTLFDIDLDTIKKVERVGEIRREEFLKKVGAL